MVGGSAVGAWGRRARTSDEASDETTEETPRVVVEALAVLAEAFGYEPPRRGRCSGVVKPAFTFHEVASRSRGMDDGRRDLLDGEAITHLVLRTSQLDWYLRTDPRRLAPLVVANWQPHRVADIRDAVRILLGWWAAFDAALSEARLHPSATGNETANTEETA